MVAPRRRHAATAAVVVVAQDWELALVVVLEAVVVHVHVRLCVVVHVARDVVPRIRLALVHDRLAVIRPSAAANSLAVPCEATVAMASELSVRAVHAVAVVPRS